MNALDLIRREPTPPARPFSATERRAMGALGLLLGAILTIAAAARGELPLAPLTIAGLGAMHVLTAPRAPPRRSGGGRSSDDRG